ncbi:tape measure protein [Luteimonas soli]|uniref:Tape measure protein n=1 Tax=Luteimonas soli TaxID=1648966 RepID=A0ABV7XHE9_9GAMM
MATAGPNLRVRISADLADLKQGLGLLRGELAKVKRQSAQVAPDTSKWSAGLAAVRRQLVGIATVYTAMRAVGSFVRMADEAANLSGRLRLVTKSQDEFNRAQQQTFRIAQDTSAEWGSIVQLYTQLAQTTGMGQERILALTKVVSQAFVVSGSNAQETANGLRQLQQAMAGGILRAEEFNTINETGSRIVQALADHFGIAFGDVRKYVNAGKVSSEDFAAALLKASGEIQDDFNKMPLTVERATQQVRNALLKLVGDTDQASGASADLAEAIAGLARVLESDDTKRGFGEMVNGLAAIITAATAAANAVGRVSSKLDELTGASLPEWVKVLLLAGTGNFAGAGAALARARMPQPATPAGAGAAGNAGGGGGAAQAVQTTTNAIGGLADASALARDAIARQMALLEQSLEDGEVGLVEFYGRKKELQLADIDLQMRAAQADAAAAKTSEQRAKALTELTKLQRERAAIGPATARELQGAQESLAKEVGDIYTRLLEANGETGRARIAELETEFQALIVRLQAEGDTAGVAIVRKLINIEAAGAQIDQFQAEMQRIMGGLGDKETAVGEQVGAGMMGSVEGEQTLQAARSTSLEQLLALKQKTIEYLATLDPASPAAASALSFMTVLDTNIATVASSMDRFRNQIKDVATDALTNLFMDLVEGSKSAGDALKDFVRGFVLAMAQIAARALATYLVLQAISAISGIPVSVLAGTTATVKHGGGIVGEGGRRRYNLSPLLFGAAPRYHSGGIAGLAPNEVAAVLEKGEEVLTRNDPRHRDNGGGQGGGAVVKQPIVAIGDRAVADALAGAAGEDVIITHVRNNWQSLSRGA